MAETAQLQVRLDLTGNLTSGITKAQRSIDGLGKSVGRVGKGVGQVGAGFARAGLLVGGAAVAGLSAAAKSAIDFEDAFAGVRKTVNEADLAAAGLSFEALSKSFREMATEIPITAVQFAELGEIAGALGVKAADIEEFTRATALMGVTTNLTADEAADAFGRIGTILNLTGDDYTELADSIVALGNAGASTEAEITEITKRFAAQAKQAGLTKEEMVGLASATASLGFAPERGGTALARVFANMATNISLANEKGDTFARVTGRSIEDMQRALNKGDGLSIFMDFLAGIKDLSATDAAKVLKAAGITNTSDRTIFQAMSDQLPFINDQLEIAKVSQGALLAEAEKKFATTASKIQLFKNNIIEAGISVGEQFLPAVGRALDKIILALKDPGTKGELTQLGKDIGAAIDSIDWQAVLDGARSFVGVLKSTLSITLSILETLNKLPTEIKAAAAAFLVLNKASGGLIGEGVGNIVGGVAGAAAQGVLSRAPGIGKLFAQPVFVTNWPMGGLGGGAGAAAGGGKGNVIGALGIGGLIVAAAVPIGEAFAAALPPTLKGEGGQGMSESQTRITNAQKEQAMAIGQLQRTVSTKTDTTNDKLESNRLTLYSGLADTKAATVAGTAAQAALLSTGIAATMTTAMGTQGAVRSSAASNAAIISGAIRANRPIITTIVNVSATQVTKNTVIQNRYGAGNGSRGSDPDRTYGGV